jgi:hypothetical protein
VADGFFNQAQDIAAWANRRGGKTLASSMLAALEYRFSDDRIKGRVLSGSEDQAKALYEYWAAWCHTDGLLSHRLTDDPGRLLTRLDNGDFEILAASQKKVRGPGIQRLYWDEVDEIDQSIMDASIGSLTSLGNVAARVVASSTWHHAHGPMGKLVAEADKKGYRVHKWNIWESIRNCPRDRHGNGKGCKQCRLAEPCLRKARAVSPGAKVGVASKAHGLFAIDDAIKQLSQWSEDQWDAEAECKRPALDGLVYSQFDRGTHVLAGLDFNPDLPTFRAVDWGLNNFVCLWIQEAKDGTAYIVDEYWAQNQTVAAAADEINKIDSGSNVAATFVDPAGRNRNDQTGYSDIDVFRSKGIPCRYTLSPWAREVRNGINMVRAALRPAAGKPRLYISGRCKQMIRAFESYKLRKVNGEWVDEPVKPQEFDHGADAYRYYTINRNSGLRASAGTMGHA